MSFKDWSAAQTAASKANSVKKADAAALGPQPKAKPKTAPTDDMANAKS